MGNQVPSAARWILLIVSSIAAGIGCRKSEENRPTKRSPPTEKPVLKRTLDKEQEDALTALGYFDRVKVKNPEARNVTKEAARVFDGYNLYNSRHQAEAYLVDMSGKVVHTWKGKTRYPPWMHMALLKNGDLIVICKSSYVARYSWNSKRIFQRSTRAHHDLVVDETGNIHLLSLKIRPHDFEGTPLPIVDDQIVIMSQKGKVHKKRQLYPIVKSLVPVQRLLGIRWLMVKGTDEKKLTQEGGMADVTHINSIQILSKPIEGIAPKGAYLLSSRELNRILILDSEGKELLWSYGEGVLEGQHHATQLENGNIMVFDNGIIRKRSRIIEIDPKTETIVWTYDAPHFFSQLRGAAQPLPNGNVLITESDKGHVFEITREGKKVWEFWNPDVQGEKSPTRAVIYRMTRYPLDYLEPGLL